MNEYSKAVSLRNLYLSDAEKCPLDMSVLSSKGGIMGAPSALSFACRIALKNDDYNIINKI